MNLINNIIKVVKGIRKEFCSILILLNLLSYCIYPYGSINIHFILPTYNN